MGNRSGSSRSKSRENKYKYQENYQNNIPTNKGIHRAYSSPQNGYSQHSYSNGYGQHNGSHLIGNTQSQYPVTQTHHYQHNNTNTNPKSNSNKILYVANYDFTGTSASGELSFIKGDRLEILDRYT
jgi:hypothetical protein